ncbi:hypothetical protein [Streptomyces sp. CAU 1734]|uniref:hypothetical protein n=1 Tax=Streptomyces sp. CAU 1734 TaxID=3140360 RepID=UPI0032611282
MTASAPATRYGSHPRRRRYAAAGAATATTALLLLTGCVTTPAADPAARPAAGKSPAGTGTDRAALATGPVRAAVLDETGIKELMPAGDAVGGWQNAGSPAVVNIADPIVPGTRTCAATADLSCRKALFSGTSLFVKEGEGTISFTLFAYPNAMEARAAWPHLRKRGDTLRPPVTAAGLPGAIGEQREARHGTHRGLGTPAAHVQIRVGTTLLVIETGGLDAERPDGRRLGELAAMFAERSRQAQSGEPVTARVDG